jgi:hypothetical protein
MCVICRKKIDVIWCLMLTKLRVQILNCKEKNWELKHSIENIKILDWSLIECWNTHWEVKVCLLGLHCSPASIAVIMTWMQPNSPFCFRGHVRCFVGRNHNIKNFLDCQIAMWTWVFKLFLFLVLCNCDALPQCSLYSLSCLVFWCSLCML